ncbi:hypothetical protein O159_09930 [Leifsonia xyli subsp. cynodontis DSM 46306]|uniref:DUF418 domain-containing protein n=1 Tax=Leifsonia xyli subsp. cynodontis DSM 46306 TaxID=1389489 RepID=U3P6M3_LEIXC|nr:DUF418 domain-containing protein [Leifsonia xyli]AGW41109.1 hypothetical protein O159_09930 [Leifsonia xyli subsp. cynodontis DSM 46306]
MSQHSAPTPPAAIGTAASRRLPVLDVIWGFSLCGITLVNIGPLTRFGEFAERSPASLNDASGWLELFVHQRFFVLFSLLFGIGFALFFSSAQRRTERPRLALLRRLLLLLAIGSPFEILMPGSALLPYAIVGLVVLLPCTWLPRWLVALAGVALVAGALALDGGLLLIPGLFLMGAALTRYGVVSRLGVSRTGSALAFLAFAFASIPALLWQLSDGVEASGFTMSSAVAGFTLAGAYLSLLSLLMTARAAAALEAVFVPFGRMALTNYVTSAPLMLLAGVLFDLRRSDSWTLLLSIAVAILLLQWVWSALWLRAFSQGPLEWLWRWGTWCQRPPLRRGRERHRAEAGGSATDERVGRVADGLLR